MRERELELIAALVEGRLQDESEARALIETSEEARVEYEAQKIAFEALTASPSVSLTEVERSALRRDVWTTLRTEPTATRSVPWYYRWVPVAAAGVLVVGLAGVLSQTGGGDGDDLVNRQGVAGTTTTADAVSEAGGDGSQEAPAAFGGVDAAFYSREANKIRESQRITSETDSQSEDEESAARSRCLEVAGFEDFEIVGEVPLAPAEGDSTTTTASSGLGSVFAAVSRDSSLTEAVVVFIDAQTCEIVHLDD